MKPAQVFVRRFLFGDWLIVFRLGELERQCWAHGMSISLQLPTKYLLLRSPTGNCEESENRTTATVRHQLRELTRALPQNCRGVITLLGVTLLLISLFAKIAILWTVGVILVIVGLVLSLLGATGDGTTFNLRPLGRRACYDHADLGCCCEPGRVSHAPRQP